MKQFLDSPFNLTTFASSLDRHSLHGTFVCKIGVLFAADGSCIVDPQQAEFGGDDFVDSPGGRECVAVTDFAPMKPAADVLLTATLPRLPALKTAMPLKMQVGSLSKQVLALGGRLEPAEMKLSYRSAFGGTAFEFNPIGRGFSKGSSPGLIYPEDLKSGFTAATRPAGFGPVSPDWFPRRNKLGTYKKDYVKRRWPWFPEDFDWTYFNAAPEDQQVKGFLRGDEEIELVNLHPTAPVYRTRLPGLVPNCFVQDRLNDGTERVRQVQLNLDTLFIDVVQGKGTLVWRGVLEVRSLKLQEIECVLIVAHKLGLQMSEEYASKEMKRRATPAVVAIPEPQEIAEARVTNVAKKAAKKKEMEEQISRAEQLVEEQTATARQKLAEKGLDPDLLQTPPKQSALLDLIAQLDAKAAGMEQKFPALTAPLAQAVALLKDAEPLTYVYKPEPAPGVEEVKTNAARKQPMPERNYEGMDLSGIDFSDVDLRGSSFRNAKLVGCLFQRSRMHAVDFSGANASGCDFTHATLIGADFSGAMLREAKFQGALIDDAILSNQELSSLDFSSCRGERADFSGSKFENANFSRAQLSQADFSGGELMGADFSDAIVAAAQFDGVKANSIRMDHADLTGLHGAGGDFTNGRFRNSTAVGAIFEKAIADASDFTGANLERASFSEASAKGAKFAYCQMSESVFDDADLNAANFLNANLFKASFDRTNLAHATLRKANVFESSFWETRFDGTTADGANLKGTTLA